MGVLGREGSIIRSWNETGTDMERIRIKSEHIGGNAANKNRKRIGMERNRNGIAVERGGEVN